MAKKNRAGDDSPEKKGRGKSRSMELFSLKLENIDGETIKRHIFYLVIISLLTKFLVLAVSSVYTFVDYFDIGFYLEHAVLIGQGQLPYIGFGFDYPVLVFVPILLAFIPAMIFQNPYAFVYSFQFLMVLCDLITLFCVYLIALKISNERTAFIAAILYATAFSTTYFVLTKYDAFPTCLLMLAVLFTLYGLTLKGYLFAGLGFFAKIFPAIAFPFLILHNMNKSSLADEIINVLKVMVPLSAVLLLPVLIIRPEAIRTYFFATGASIGVYVNTATYTIYSWISGVAGVDLSPETVSMIMYGLMAAVILCLLYIAYRDPAKRPATLLKILLCAFIAVIFFTKFHSPQYIVWFTPFLCILVADDLVKIVLFYLVQVLAYIEFPVMFGSFYTNLEYTNTAGSSGWYLTLVFFTLQYLILLILVFTIIRPEFRILQKSG